MPPNERREGIKLVGVPICEGTARCGLQGRNKPFAGAPEIWGILAMLLSEVQALHFRVATHETGIKNACYNTLLLIDKSGKDSTFLAS